MATELSSRGDSCRHYWPGPRSLHFMLSARSLQYLEVRHICGLSSLPFSLHHNKRLGSCQLVMPAHPVTFSSQFMIFGHPHYSHPRKSSSPHKSAASSRQLVNGTDRRCLRSDDTYSSSKRWCTLERCPDVFDSVLLQIHGWTAWPNVMN